VAWNIAQEITAAKIGLMAQLHNVQLESVPMGPGELWVENRVDAATRRLIVETLDADLAGIAQNFNRLFAVKPKIVTFATAESFERGLTTLFDYPQQTARALARNNGGALVIPLRSIAINWAVLGKEKPLTILRHELAHAMIREIAGASAVMPSWFDEGIATMEQASGSLARIADAGDFIRESAAARGRTYQLAAASIDALKGQIGLGGMSRILDQLGRGTDFESAYANVTGRALSSFLQAAPSEIVRAAPTKVVMEELPSGEVRWTLRGGVPGQKASVDVNGRDVAYRLTFEVEVDQNGSYTSAFGATAPAGTYFVQVVAGDSEVSGTARVRKG